VTGGWKTASFGAGTEGSHQTFRATVITAYLKNGGALENARAMEDDASTRTTQLYARCPKEASADEIERICR